MVWHSIWVLWQQWQQRQRPHLVFLLLLPNISLTESSFNFQFWFRVQLFIWCAPNVACICQIIIFRNSEVAKDKNKRLIDTKTAQGNWHEQSVDEAFANHLYTYIYKWIYKWIYKKSLKNLKGFSVKITVVTINVNTGFYSL